MAASSRGFLLSRFALAVSLLLLPALLLAADRYGRVSNVGGSTADDQGVEMFKAIADGQIDVKLIPKDSTQCNVLIANKTDKPLSVKLPAAFAGVPVLAQAQGGGTKKSGTSTNNTSGSQSMGGGMMGGMGGGMGMMNIAPEKVGQLKATTVCLEHGKTEPRPAVKYEIKPIDSFTDKPGVRELCEMVGSGQISQRAAQAAAWHLNNDMSWQELSAKRLHYANGTSRPYFTPQEIQAAMRITVAAVAEAERRKQQQPQESPGDVKSPGDTATTSN